MLPDLRIVIAAVVSTFVVTVGVGFYASSRLIHEQMTARLDGRGLDDTPVNRIALNWPEPTSQERRLDLDFAITLKASRNPVRDIAPAGDVKAESAAAEREPAPAIAPPVPVIETPNPPPATETAVQPDPLPLAESPREDERPDNSVAVHPSATDDTRPAPESNEAALAIAAEPQQHEPRHPEPPSPDRQQMALLQREERVEAAPQDVTASGPSERPAAAQTETARIAATTADPEGARDSRPDITGSIAAPHESPTIPLPEPRPRIAARPTTEDAAPAAQPAAAATAPAPRKKRPRKSVKQTAAVRSQSAQTLQPFDFFGLFRVQPLPLRDQPRSDTTPP
jgi:hypothetical protein